MKKVFNLFVLLILSFFSFQLITNAESVLKCSPFHFCQSYGILKAFSVVHTLITIIKIIIPIVLIVLGSIDYGKAAIANDDKQFTNSTNTLIRRIVIAVVIFLIPTIVDASLNYFVNYEKAKGDFRDCFMCFSGNDSCKDALKKAKTRVQC